MHSRKAVHDQGEKRPEKKNIVGEESERAHPEGPVGDVVATAYEEADDWDSIGDIE